MTYGTAPTSGGSGDAVTTDTIATIDGGSGSYGEAQIVKVGFGVQSDLKVVSPSQGLPISINETEFPAGLPTYDDALNSNIASTSNSRDARSLLDVLDPLGDNYVAPQAEIIGDKGLVIRQTADGSLYTQSDDFFDTQACITTVGTNLLTGSGRWLDTQGFSSLVVTLSGNTASGGYIVEATNTPGSGASVGAGSAGGFGIYGVQLLTSSGAAQASIVQNFGNSNTIPANTTFIFGLSARYIRFRVTTAGTNGGTVFVRLCRIPIPLPVGSLQVTQATAASLLCTNTPLVPTAATNLSSAATTNATSVKASAGRITSCVATNNGAAVCFLKLYNKASAPTVGTDVPALVISIPANGVPAEVPCGPLGLQFSTGIAYALTNLIADADTTAVVAGQVKLMMSYV